MCADAGVLKLIGEEKRRDYGMTLIHLAGKHNVGCRQSPSLLSVEDSKENLKERIQAVCRYRRLTLAAGLCMAVLLAAAALFLLTGCPSSGTGSPAEPPAAGTSADPSKESEERTESSETENSETMRLRNPPCHIQILLPARPWKRRLFCCPPKQAQKAIRLTRNGQAFPLETDAWQKLLPAGRKRSPVSLIRQIISGSAIFRQRIFPCIRTKR